MTTTTPQAGKLVYRFDEGNASMVDLLGGKGSNKCHLQVEPASWLKVVLYPTLQAYVTKPRGSSEDHSVRVSQWGRQRPGVHVGLLGGHAQSALP